MSIFTHVNYLLDTFRYELVVLTSVSRLGYQSKDLLLKVALLGNKRKKLEELLEVNKQRKAKLNLGNSIMRKKMELE